jgi:hypothetical protein
LSCSGFAPKQTSDGTIVLFVLIWCRILLRCLIGRLYNRFWCWRALHHCEKANNLNLRLWVPSARQLSYMQKILFTMKDSNSIQKNVWRTDGAVAYVLPLAKPVPKHTWMAAATRPWRTLQAKWKWSFVDPDRIWAWE